MKQLTISILSTLLLLIIPICSFAEEQTDITAIVVAEKFVKTLDQSEFKTAWHQTSSVNHRFTDPPLWFKQITVIRPLLGSVVKRPLEKLSRHANWVGLPDGDYLRVSFATLFSHKANSRETVVLVKEEGKWVVSSYHLK